LFDALHNRESGTVLDFLKFLLSRPVMPAGYRPNRHTRRAQEKLSGMSKPLRKANKYAMNNPGGLVSEMFREKQETENKQRLAARQTNI
jgi:hypothetical protein